MLAPRAWLGALPPNPQELHAHSLDLLAHRRTVILPKQGECTRSKTTGPRYSPTTTIFLRFEKPRRPYHCEPKEALPTGELMKE